MSSWNQPICERDFFRRRLTVGDPLEASHVFFDYDVWEDNQHVMLAVIAAPVRVKQDRAETRVCCDCGKRPTPESSSASTLTRSAPHAADPASSQRGRERAA